MRGWLREQLGLALDCQLVGIVAALREEKNHQQFIEAAAKVIQQHPHTHFVVVGEGIMRQSIESWIASNRLESHFHLLGNRSDTERILAGLDVFALTSRNEANPVSILEALATGIPVVSPDVGSIHETVLHEKTGLLTTPLDAEGTAAAVSRLLSNPAWARELGLTGRANVRQNWSLDAMVQGYEKLVVQLYNTKAEVCGRPLWPVGEQQFAGEALSVPLPLLPDGQAWQVEPGANFSPTN
jgi:glycosyltransferase involved in cell wall biosynthesis